MFVNIFCKSNYSILNSVLSIDKIINFSLKNNIKICSLMDKNVMFGTMEFYKKCIKNNLKPIIGLCCEYKNDELYLIASNINGLENLYKISSNINCNKEEIFENIEFNNIYVISKNNINQNYFSQCKKFFAKSEIAIKECCYEKKEDWKYLKTLYCINNNLLFDSYEDDEQFKNLELIDENNKLSYFTQSQLENLSEIIENVNIDIDLHQKIDLIQYDEKQDPLELITDICKKKLNLLFDNNIPNNYLQRFEYELEIIKNMNFINYFLIVSDYVKWAKSQNILVGPGRGSACGSLVVYLLEISNVDPIKYNLLFERFLNPMRVTMPDIDVDFEHDRAEEVITYLKNKYKGCVTNIITFQTIQSKSAIRDVGRALGLDLSIVNEITKELKNDEDFENYLKNNKKIKQYVEKYPLLFELAINIINCPRQISSHAAGIIINSHIGSKIPIILNNNTLCSQFDMKHLEELGIIKFDILKLANLTIINKCISLIRNKNKEFDIYNIELSDKKVFDDLLYSSTEGVFQLESPGMKNTLIKIKPKSIEELSLVIAIFRPGPVSMLNELVKNKSDINNIKYIDDKFTNILKPTFGIIIYQEQLIEIVKIICNYNYAEADIFRRIISKKDNNKLNELKIKFIKDGINNNNDEEKVKKIFSYIEQFASYGFNKSHSIAYSIIVYWTAYLRFYYPTEFFLTSLNNVLGDNNKINSYLLEMSKKNIIVKKPDLRYSEYFFTLKNNEIYFGIGNVKGFGQSFNNTLTKIKEQISENSNIFQIIKICIQNGITIKTLEILIKIGCFDFLLIDKSRYWLLMNLEEIFTKVKTMTNTGEFIFEPNIIDVIPNSEQNEHLVEEERNILGFDFSLIKTNFNMSTPTEVKNEGEIIGKIISIEKKIQKDGREYARIKILNANNQILWGTVFNNLWKTYNGKLIVGNTYKINIKKTDYGFVFNKFIS